MKHSVCSRYSFDGTINSLTNNDKQKMKWVALVEVAAGVALYRAFRLSVLSNGSLSLLLPLPLSWPFCEPLPIRCIGCQQSKQIYPVCRISRIKSVVSDGYGESKWKCMQNADTNFLETKNNLKNFVKHWLQGIIVRLSWKCYAYPVIYLQP